MYNNTVIKTLKTIYPQIYAYILPTVPENKGWIKIGYTERKNIDDRIKEQTKTAAINLSYIKLWSGSAKFEKTDDWFKDKEFHSYLRNHKKIEQRSNSEWFYYDTLLEKSYEDFEDFCNSQFNQSEDNLIYHLREEQHQAVSQTLEYLIKNKKSEYLWNAKPRFGKTLTTYDLARKMNAENVLIVTNRPAVANSWFDDFQKFIAWQTDFSFVSTNDSLKNRPVMNRKEFVHSLLNNDTKRMIAFISLQDLKGAISFGGSHDKLSWVKELKWDLLVIDESHEGVDTFKTDIAFENIKRDFTLHLSGTPFKAVAEGKFSSEQIFNWTYADEQQTKLTWENSEEKNPYEKLPKLNLFTYQMSQMITEKVSKGAEINGRNVDFAFDLNEFFETSENGKFIYEKEINMWLNTLSSNEKYPFSTKKLRNELKHTLWLLNRVSSAKALQKMLESHPVFENYKIILAAGNSRGEDDQIINQKSLDRVKEAILNNDKTITISVGQLTTGVTIPEWTAILMLSNMRSPSLYMQAAFRSQNPWEYEVNGEWYQKENAYVFDFAPERTLIIYDEFANNLYSKTSNGNGNTSDRKNNISKLLNFFPVIAEDKEGSMIELDVNQLLTIPKAIKAQEVVRRGFMSNLLFQNISGIFSSTDAREILEQLNPVDQGKSNVRKSNSSHIDLRDIQIDDTGEIVINEELLTTSINAHFGDKVYETVKESVEELINQDKENLSKAITNNIIQSTQDSIKLLAKEKGLSVKFAEQIVRNNANILTREVEVLQKKSDIKKNEVRVEFENSIYNSSNDTLKIEELKINYESKQKQIEEKYKTDIQETIENKNKYLLEKSAETILKKSEEKKKNSVEEDVRSRLRGFTRSIPSFLMAYGEATTTLSTFDKTISEEVFKEVTGISLHQFRMLRDTYNFFDSVVFDESIKEFLNKRSQLANYFEEEQEEDIFDYIPPQKTNQIFTPKKVVKMMVDQLEKENPEIFKNPEKTFVDLYMKSGLYITEIVKRLYTGLETEIPNKDERLKHIFENQVYGFAPSEIIYNIARNYIFSFNDKANKINDSNIVFLDTTPYAKGETEVSFEEKCNELFGGREK